MSDGEKASIKLKFDPNVRLEFHGATIASEHDSASGQRADSREHIPRRT